MKKQKLILDQVDRRIMEILPLDSIVMPQAGWIYSIRQALGMSLRQLGKRLNITAQSVKELEEREKSGTVSLNVLRQFGASLDMKLIYCFIPKTGSLEKMIENRAVEIATQIVQRTSSSMILEDQGNTEARLKQSILEKASEITLEMPKLLWD
ncbi:MAG: mobile mystery protein A [Bacteroidota bacterium]